jgi:protein SCO1/2
LSDIRGLVAAAFTAGLSVALLGSVLWPRSIQQRSAAELMDVVMWDREPIGGPFRLIDHEGTTRTDRDFRGKLLLIYFGFTYCSDSCPTDLQTIAMVMEPRLCSLCLSRSIQRGTHLSS